MNDDDLGASTYRGLRFLEQMICFMLDHDVDEYRYPKRDIPLDYTEFPFEIVRYEKVVKVLKMHSKSYEDQAIKYFDLHDPETGRDLVFSFQDSEDGRSLIFRMVAR